MSDLNKLENETLEAIAGAADEAALEAARTSTFAPATRNQAPVESEAVANYRFELR
jgi:hypothetical protein